MFDLLDLLFPPVCLSCNKFGQFFCSDCQTKAEILDETICPFCLQKTLNGVKHPKCKGYIDGLISVFKYKKEVQKIIKEIKYRYYKAGVGKLVDFFLKNLRNSEFDKFLASKPILVPIPLHSKKMSARGFNQAQLIAQILAKSWQLPISNKFLVRAKNTQVQAELKKAQRQQNMKNAFIPSREILKIGSKSLQNKNILLVDDVWTTGSTMQEAAKVLKKLAAKKIWGVTVAR
jgi:ComF family protein